MSKNPISTVEEPALKHKDTDRGSSQMDGDSASQLSDLDINSASNDDSSNVSPNGGSNSSGSHGTNMLGMFQNNRDDRHISGAKCLFLTLLMAAAAGLGVVIYYSTAASEQGDFQSNVGGICDIFHFQRVKF